MTPNEPPAKKPDPAPPDKAWDKMTPFEQLQEVARLGGKLVRIIPPPPEPKDLR